MKKKIHLTDGDSKYDASFDPSNAENFLFTWKMISANFNAEMQNINKVGDLILKVDKFLNIRNVSGEFIFILQMFTLQIVDKSTSYTFKIVN